jgi:hypothetical protein
MFTFVDKVVFRRAREVGMGVFVGFVMLGAGANPSPAADATNINAAPNPGLDWLLAPASPAFFNSVSLPEPASAWFYSVAGGLCLLILVRRKAQL